MSSALQGPAFEEFNLKFKGDLVFPSDPDYAAAIRRWAHNAERRAAVVAFVKDAEDVALAINFVRKTSPRLTLAIKGGGHNVAGCSSAEDGLVIDLSRYINKARADPDKKLVYVGGGAVWKTVDEEASKYGLATIAGTVNDTGVGGLAVGGGYGLLTGEHGLVIDNMRQATVVVGDGRILTASDTENPDLFFGIRGGGSNFGVVTEFVFQLHPQLTTIFLTQLIYAPPQVEQLFETTEVWWNNRPSGKETMFIVLSRGPPPERYPCAIAFLFYNGSVEEGSKCFKAFHALKPAMDLSRMISYVEVNSLMNKFNSPGSCYYMKGVTQSRMTGALGLQLLNTVASFTEEPGFFDIAVVFENWSLEKIRQVSPEAMAFNNRSTDRNVLVSVKYPTEQDTPQRLEEAKSIVHELADMIVNAEETEADKETSRTRAYANYGGDTVNFSSDRAAAAIFGSNFPKLREIKKKYDPEFLFNKWFPIPPAA